MVDSWRKDLRFCRVKGGPFLHPFLAEAGYILKRPLLWRVCLGCTVLCIQECHPSFTVPEIGTGFFFKKKVNFINGEYWNRVYVQNLVLVVCMDMKMPIWHTLFYGLVVPEIKFINVKSIGCQTANCSRIYMCLYRVFKILFVEVVRLLWLKVLPRPLLISLWTQQV